MSPVISIQRLNGDKAEACSGQLAAHTFTHALCTCEDLRAAQLTTVSFDSNNGLDAGVDLWGASVGVGGLYSAQVGSQIIHGSLTISGTENPSVISNLDVSGDLRIAGQATLLSVTRVGRDAWAAGRVMVFLGYATIARTLNLSPPATFAGLVNGAVTSTNRNETTTFAIDPVCGCGAADKLDLNAMVATGISQNENARIGLDAKSLSNVTGPATTVLSLTCGRFYLESIGGLGPAKLVIGGRVALFVDGDVQGSDLFQLQISNGGELDLFIRGNLILAPGVSLGDMAKPRATRIYVGGTQDIQIPGAQVSANFYVPNANVTISSSPLRGSVYARNLNGGGLVANYDRAILSQGLRCDPPTTCDKCHVCNGGTACVDGACSPCQNDSQCCAPFVCDQGACLPLHP